MNFYLFQTKIVRTIDLINTFNFPFVIYNVSLNEYASQYFFTDFREPVFMKDFNNNISIPISNAYKPVLKLKFYRSKFLEENYKCDCESQTSYNLNKHHKQIAKLRLYTNYTHFDIELFIYDGLIKIVSY